MGSKRVAHTGSVEYGSRHYRTGEKLQADETKGLANVTSEMSKCGGEVGRTSHAQQRDGEVSQRRHRVGGLASAHLRTVLVKRHISYPVKAVLDGPMPPVEVEQCFGGRVLSAVTGDAEGNLLAQKRAIQFANDAFDTEDLSNVGEIEVRVELFTRPNAALLNAAVALVGGGVLRGEKPPSGVPRCRLAGWVGCL